MGTSTGDGPSEASAKSASEVFEQLRDFRHLTRERALSQIKEALATSKFAPDEVEPFVLSACKADSWEAKQGGLLAAAECVRAWDRPNFRNVLLSEAARLLQDPESRVRKAVAALLCECCRRDGLSVYDAMSEAVLGDIRDKFKRSEADDELPDLSAPPTFLHDTEGWRSLETSMGALESMMQGCGLAFTPRINGEMLGLLADCTRHTNRFVREYAFFAFKNAFDVCDADVFLETIAPKTVQLVSEGIRDNWSQVRYAASIATRAFMEKAGENRTRFYAQLLGPMCLNRHYVAEGVRLFSQDTWRFICGPQGGARLLMTHFDNVIEAYDRAASAANHAVREAACHCTAELVIRVAGSPTSPSVYRDHFTHVRVRKLLDMLLGAAQDESWPVRDVAGTALGHFVRMFPVDVEAQRSQLFDFWFESMSDNIPSLRQNSATAAAMAVGVWADEVWDEVMRKLAKILPQIEFQPENSQTFTDYTPSGPFSVPRSKPMGPGDMPDPSVTNQTMYSCGSVAPKTFKRRGGRGGAGAGCMNCDAQLPQQFWEASEGMVHLFAELVALAATAHIRCADARLDQLAALLPVLAKAFSFSHFRHHHLLKQRVCERLPKISEGLQSRRVLPTLPHFLKVVADSAVQSTHHGLRERARDVLTSWRQQFPRSDLEAACRSAEVDAQLLLG